MKEDILKVMFQYCLRLRPDLNEHQFVDFLIGGHDYDPTANPPTLGFNTQEKNDFKTFLLDSFQNKVLNSCGWNNSTFIHRRKIKTTANSLLEDIEFTLKCILYADIAVAMGKSAENPCIPVGENIRVTWVDLHGFNLFAAALTNLILADFPELEGTAQDVLVPIATKNATKLGEVYKTVAKKPAEIIGRRIKAL